MNCSHCGQPISPKHTIEGAKVYHVRCSMEATRGVRERFQKRNRELDEKQGVKRASI